MTLTVAFDFAALIVLLACSAFFSSSETALFSLNALRVHRIRRSHPKAADRIERLRANPKRLLSSILIGNTLVNVAASGLGYMIARHFYTYGEAVAIPVMTLLLLIFGEVAPKRLAMSKAEKMAAFYAPALVLLVRVVTPIRAVLERFSDLFEKSLRVSASGLTEDEFLTVVEVGEEEGVLDEEERTMVDGIIRLEETQASDVMTPRVDLTGIDLDEPAEERERIAASVRFRYLPVYRGSVDQAEGFLDVPRFLLSPDRNFQAALIPPFAVPETAPLDSLLATFQKEGKRVAFVVDEYGGTAGLVTRGDILEEIASDVENEYGDEKTAIQQLDDRHWIVDGSTSLEDVNYETDLNLDADGVDRIAGWVTAQAERIPRAGEIVTAQFCRATVQKVRKHRILLVLLEKLPAPAAGSEGEMPE